MDTTFGIIGAGITGLTLARVLYYEGFDITIYEKQSTPGGVMQSYRDGNWLAETGPNTFLVKTGRVERFLQHTGIANQRVFASEKAGKRYIVRNGKPRPLPTGPGKLIRSDLFSLPGKFRLLKEPFVGRPPDNHDQTVAEFVRRRLGTEFLDYAINPFVAGVYAGDPKKLSLKHAMPRMHKLEQQYGSLFWGQLRGRSERKERDKDLPDNNRIFSFPEGLGQLATRLAEPLTAHISYGTTVENIGPSTDGRWNLTCKTDQSTDRRQHETLISTIPLHALPNLQLDIQSADHIQTLQSVSYPPVSVWTLGFSRTDVEHPLDGFGMLLPERENRNILGTLFSSTLFPGRAPADHVTLTTFVGGARQPDMARKPKDEQRSLILADLTDLLGLRGDPVFEHAVQWPHAIPQFELGYGKIKSTLEQLEEANPGLHFAGNFRSGASLNDCIDYAIQLGKKLGNG